MPPSRACQGAPAAYPKVLRIDRFAKNAKKSFWCSLEPQGNCIRVPLVPSPAEWLDRQEGFAATACFARKPHVPPVNAPVERSHGLQLPWALPTAHALTSP
jgi:hypothetical protein